ncbi:hypothetical protein BDC45DRAFT_445333 [Circinella umbellata]|nr:hypothetical protein BDC45DRAFT_445333 [Circinella umbellata]
MTLVEYGFPECHDYRHPNAVTYLGSPLFTTNHQLDQFLNTLLSTIQHHCNLHLQRQLSFRGRATIMNSLILSKLWHILRLTGAPQGTFWNKLRSIIYQLMTHRTFPKMSFE